MTLEVDVDVRILGSSPEDKGTTSFRGDELKATFIVVQRKEIKERKEPQREKQVLGSRAEPSELLLALLVFCDRFNQGKKNAVT